MNEQEIINKEVSKQIPYSKKECIDLGYAEGYANRTEEILGLIENWWRKTMQISNTSTRLEELKKSITQTQTKAKEVKNAS